MKPLRELIFMVFVLAQYCYGAEEEFTEELLLRPLPDGRVLSHFHFEHKAPSPNINGGAHHHYNLFPKQIHHLVHKFQIQEMELSFTQGRWNYEKWGGFDPISSRNVKPPGVELWAMFDVPTNEVDETWKNLTHTLSGLFCASINFLESTTAYSAPVWGFQQYVGGLRYGALPREAVCTENLTPWLKLLPCRDKAGLASVLERSSIYNGSYHSQRLRLTSTENEIVLQQIITVVLQPRTVFGGRLQNSWTVSSIFGRKTNQSCILAKSSSIFIELESTLLSQLNQLEAESDKTSEDYLDNSAFELSVTPNRVIKEAKSSYIVDSSVLFEYNMDKFAAAKLQNIGLMWKIPVVWACRQAPFHANRFLLGSGNERGSIAISLRSTRSGMGIARDNVVDGTKVEVVVLQVVPWYVKVYFHSLQVFVDGEFKNLADIVEKMHVSPSEDRVSTGVMEMILRFPHDVNSIVLTMEFDKGFLHIDEYPPDANQGFDIPSAVISFPSAQASRLYPEDNLTHSPLLQKLQEENSLLSYTEVLLVPLATPDFSMPYNVITITCTVFALYFGSLLNVLRRRVGEEERFLNSEASKRAGPLGLLIQRLYAKLRRRPLEQPESPPPASFFDRKLIFKVVLVAGVAIGWHFYFG